MSRSRRLTYYAWPGIVFGFYLYYYLVEGSWDYYFSGRWTLENDQTTTWLDEGFFFAPAIPKVVAAPLTLLTCGALSFATLSLVEKGFIAARNPSPSRVALPVMRQSVRHKMLVGSGFVAYLVFYLYGGAPVLALAPSWVGQLFTLLVAVAATSVFWSRANATQSQAHSLRMNYEFAAQRRRRRAE